MSTHIMVDIETLGVDNAPPVLQIAAMDAKGCLICKQ